MTYAWLERIIYPTKAEEFFGQYWEGGPLLVKRGEPSFYNEFLTIKDFDEALNRNPANISYVSNIDNGRTKLEATGGYSNSDIAEALSQLEAGSTLVLDALQKNVPPLAELCRGLQSEIGFEFWTNAYLTPPNCQGFKSHYDTHDVFILQIHGTKRWRVGSSPVALPLPFQTDGASKMSEQPMEAVMEPGDLLFIPRVCPRRSSDRTRIVAHNPRNGPAYLGGSDGRGGSRVRQNRCEIARSYSSSMAARQW
jgi:bifunctional lysine-specific demethylase and histidyl-hydroxylase MINA